MKKYIAVIEGDPNYHGFTHPRLEKHMAFPAEVVPVPEHSLRPASEVDLTVRGKNGAMLTVRVDYSDVRTVELGSTQGSLRGGPELHDFVQVVGRKLGGIVTKFSAGLFFVRFANSEIPIPKAQLTYDDDRGVWYYLED